MQANPDGCHPLKVATWVINDYQACACLLGKSKIHAGIYSPRRFMRTLAFSFLYLSFIYVYPIYKLPFGNVSHIRLDDIGFAAAFLFYLFSRKDFSRLNNDHVFKAFSIYLAYLGFTLCWAAIKDLELNRAIQFGGFFYIKFWQYFVIYIMLRTSVNSITPRLFKWLFSLMALYTVVAATLQYQGVLDLRYDPTIPQNTRHATSTLSFNYAHLGLFSLVAIGLLLAFYEESKNALMKGVFLGLVIASLYTLMISGSRSGIFGVSVVVMVAGVQSNRKVGYIAGCLIGIIALLLYGIPDIFLDRIDSALDQDATGIGRVRSWLQLGNLIAASPLDIFFGLGFMQFKFSDAVDILGINAGHNNFLNAYVESGIFGFMLFVYVVLKLFKHFYETRHLSNLTKARFAIWCGILVTCISQETLTVNFAMTSFMGFLMFTLGALENHAESQDLSHCSEDGLRRDRNDSKGLCKFRSKHEHSCSS